MVWERAGTMLIILSIADNCTVPTNKIEPNQWLSISSLIWSTLPYTWTLRSLSIFHKWIWCPLKSPRTLPLHAIRKSRQGGPRYKLRLPTGVFHDLWNSRTTRFKNPVPEEVIYYDRSSGVGRRPFAQPIQQTAWDNTLSSHQVNCWHTFRLSNIAMDNFTPIEFYRSLSPIIKPPFLEISQLAMFDCQSVVWQGPRRFNETTWGIPKHQPAGSRDPGHSADYPTRWTIPPLWASVFEEGWSKAPSHGPNASKTLVAQNSVQIIHLIHTRKWIEIDKLSGMWCAKHWPNHLCRTVWSNYHWGVSSHQSCHGSLHHAAPDW